MTSRIPRNPFPLDFQELLIHHVVETGSVEDLEGLIRQLERQRGMAIEVGDRTYFDRVEKTLQKVMGAFEAKQKKHASSQSKPPLLEPCPVEDCRRPKHPDSVGHMR